MLHCGTSHHHCCGQHGSHILSDKVLKPSCYIGDSNVNTSRRLQAGWSHTWHDHEVMSWLDQDWTWQVSGDVGALLTDRCTANSRLSLTMMSTRSWFAVSASSSFIKSTASVMPSHRQFYCCLVRRLQSDSTLYRNCLDSSTCDDRRRLAVYYVITTRHAADFTTQVVSQSSCVWWTELDAGCHTVTYWSDLGGRCHPGTWC